MSKRGRASTWITLIVGALLVAGFYLWKPPLPGVSACANAPLVVNASNEKSGLLGEMAADFMKTAPQLDGQCISVKVVRKASGEAEEALARGWNESTDGPRPDVWSPAATSWVEILRAHRVGSDRSDLIPSSLPSLMQSPLTIAMPRPMAEALGWPEKPIGWHDILALARDERGWARHGHPEWGRFRLGKTNPTVSTSGLHALVGMYYAATGLTADLTVADVQRAEVTRFVKDIEQSVEHYGNTASTFMQNLGAADARGDAMGYMSAMAIEEKQLWDYNRQKARQVPLAAIYPSEGTLVADHPYVVLRGAWVDEAKRRAAALFLAYLQAPERQQRFRAEGYRDHEGRGGPDLAPQWGVLPAGPATVLPAPSADALAAVEGSWKEVRKRARVLMVLDVSGSMSGQKLENMKRGAAGSLDLFLDDDELALWSFGTDRYQITAMGPVGPRRAALSRAIFDLTVAGGTRLYDTTREAVREIASTVEASRISAVVVLTDGVNTHGSTDLEALLRDLRAATAETRVRAFTIAYGSDADRSILQRIAEATRGTSYDASDPASIETVFEEVIGNF
ncbi:MAG: substrate-binding and VWA domain-containing protein [Chloroflexota bacterium]